LLLTRGLEISKPHFFVTWNPSTFTISNNNIMYSLDCNYYTREFQTIDELLTDIALSGMDPNYHITYNGEVTGEMAIDLIQF